MEGFSKLGTLLYRDSGELCRGHSLHLVAICIRHADRVSGSGVWGLGIGTEQADDAAVQRSQGAMASVVKPRVLQPKLCQVGTMCRKGQWLFLSGA